MSRLLLLLLILLPLSTSPTAVTNTGSKYDVLIYGSTPSGIIAAIAASRHGAKTALVSQREHIGGVCTGGLGQTDIGSCAAEVIGGIPLEFFQRNAKRYVMSQPRAPWNLEPHVAKDVYLNMLNESGVELLPFAEVDSVGKSGLRLNNITMIGGATHEAIIFVDASYEGDLMSRTNGVSYTWGRESREQYNESGAGSQDINMGNYGIEYLDPFDKEGKLLPLLNNVPPLYPTGQADRGIQAYNFRLCVTDNATIRVPFKKPAGYDPTRWELLRRFWLAWPTSTNAHKAAQAVAPSAILGAIPSSSGARKFDMNNCGYNPIHTDHIGANWDYPEANYSRRKEIWQDHIDYTNGFLWFMSSDPSVPPKVRMAYATEWGLCGDEFADTDHMSPQLYVREARRLVGGTVFTQNSVMDRSPLGSKSIGMGCYGFDSHCEERYACNPKDKTGCTMYNKSYVAVQCGCAGDRAPGVYQMPISLLFPKRTEATNLLVPVCASASHVAYATIRMEPQFMILGHAAGVIAALSAHQKGNDTVAVQDVDTAKLHSLLLLDGALLNQTARCGHMPPKICKMGYRCGADTCFLSPKNTYNNSKCNGKCTAIKLSQWLLLKGHWKVGAGGLSATVIPTTGTYMKKSERISGELPPSEKRAVTHGTIEHFRSPLRSVDAAYWLGDVK